MTRITNRTVDIARQHNTNLATRLCDGRVSDRDVSDARDILARVVQNPPSGNGWQRQNWSQRVSDAADLYNTVRAQRDGQGSYVTDAENRKDNADPTGTGQVRPYDQSYRFEPTGGQRPWNSEPHRRDDDHRRDGDHRRGDRPSTGEVVGGAVVAAAVLAAIVAFNNKNNSGNR